MNQAQIEELVLQSLEHEMGGVKVYEAAVACAVNRELKAEWQKYLEQTKRHVGVLEQLCVAIDLDPRKETPGRAVVRLVGQSLVSALELARKGGEPATAELAACECVVLAETKDHLDWELVGKCAEHSTGAVSAALKAAYDAVEDEEDEHLYHTKGWCRELWIKALGMNAVLPPPEERRHVTTAIGAAKAEQAAEKER